MASIGFIGLGNMGGPLARRLLSSGNLAVHDRDPTAVQALVAAGATPAASSAVLAADCEIVFTCLPTSGDVRELIFGEEGLVQSLRRGALVVDMTTGVPGMTRAMAEELAPCAVDLIDAPVSGGPRGANEGTIAIMVGASEAQFARVKPVLDLVSVNVVHAGEVGAGHAIKAGNNLLNLICRLASFEVVSMLVRDGVDPARAVDIIQKSSGRNYATEITLPDNILSGKMFQGFTNALMRKDSGVALDIAAAVGVEMPFGELARTTLESVIEDHGLDADISTVALAFEARSGARIRPSD